MAIAAEIEEEKKIVKIERWLPLNSFFVSFSFNFVKNLFSWPIFRWLNHAIQYFRRICMRVCVCFFLTNHSILHLTTVYMTNASVRNVDKTGFRQDEFPFKTYSYIFHTTIGIFIQIHGRVVWSASLSKIAILYCRCCLPQTMETKFIE